MFYNELSGSSDPFPKATNVIFKRQVEMENYSRQWKYFSFPPIFTNP